MNRAFRFGRARLFMGFAGLRLQCVSIRIANDGSSWPGTVASARQSTCPKALGPRSEGLSAATFGTAFGAPPPWWAVASRRRWRRRRGGLRWLVDEANRRPVVAGHEEQRRDRVGVAQEEMEAASASLEPADLRYERSIWPRDAAKAPADIVLVVRLDDENRERHRLSLAYRTPVRPVRNSGKS